MGCKPSKFGSIIITLNGVIPCSGATKNSTIYLMTTPGQHLIVTEQFANMLGFTLNESSSSDLPFVSSIIQSVQNQNNGQQTIDIILSFVGHAGVTDPVLKKDVTFDSNNPDINHYVSQLPEFGDSSNLKINPVAKSSIRYLYRLSEIRIINNSIEHFNTVQSVNKCSVNFDTSDSCGSYNMYLLLVIIFVLLLFYLYKNQ